MNWRVVAVTASLTALAGGAALAGGLRATPAAAGTLAAPQAQTAQATPTPGAQATPPSTPGTQQAPAGPGGRDGGFGPARDGHGPGRGGHGGPGGFGGGSGPYTADGAARVISGTTSLIASVQADLTYATGKMDTATVQDWVNGANTLLKAAQAASSGNQYGKAVETANAAQGLARTADLLMQQALGADKLPSYSQRQGPGRGHPGAPAGTTPTQAQASRELASLYNAIIGQDAALKAAGTAGDAATYLTAAKNVYKAAYTAYQAGKYSDAQAQAAVGRGLLEAVEHLARAATAPNSSDTPITVPAPTF
jgi:hypothetical protein